MRCSHAEITHFLMAHFLEDWVFGNSKRERLNALVSYLSLNPDNTNREGQNLTDAVVRDLISRAAATIRAEDLGAWDTVSTFEEAFTNRFPELSRALDRDGFKVIEWQLRRNLPEAFDLPATDDDVHRLLRTFGFSVPSGHLDQAIQNHSQGTWAAANSQLRSFVEGLMDSISDRLEPDSAKLPARGWNRVEWLANQTPPFFLPELNEWQTDSKTGRPIGFIYGVWQRLHPHGSHPGLSDEEDSTFRLHLVLILARLLLLRLKQRLT